VCYTSTIDIQEIHIVKLLPAVCCLLLVLALTCGGIWEIENGDFTLTDISMTLSGLLILALGFPFYD